jgi:hypothetical protein
VPSFFISPSSLLPLVAEPAFSSFSLQNKKYAYSARRCVMCARNALKLIKDGCGAPGCFLEKWWIKLQEVTHARNFLE